MEIYDDGSYYNNDLGCGCAADTFCGSQSKVDEYVNVLTICESPYHDQDSVCDTY